MYYVCVILKQILNSYINTEINNSDELRLNYLTIWKQSRLISASLFSPNLA